MKKITIIAGSILAVIIIGIFLIDGRDNDTEITKQRTKVGFILNGEVDDLSWGQSHYEGMNKTAEELNLEVVYKENVPEDEQSMSYMEKLIDDGCEIIICNSFGYGEYELKVADEHPKVYFFHATGVTEAANLSTYFGRIYQIRYLTGIVAGMQTESNEIGYVAAFPISEVNRGINAFTLGVRSVNPDAQVYVEWCNSWTDDDMAVEAANKLIEAHPEIDLFTVHSDSTSVYDFAEERGLWSIGYNMDNSESFPNSFLTAAVWDWNKFYEPRIAECLKGKFQSKHYWLGAETGVVSMAPLTDNVKDGIEEVVEEKRKLLESGTYDVFYGPIYDNKGNERVAGGESMSDEAMLNDFDWYVEGVVINGEE